MPRLKDFGGIAAALCLGFIGLIAPIAQAQTPPSELRQPDLVGDYWSANRAEPGPAVLVVGGSEGGLSRGLSRVATALNAEGYSVLQVAYFGLPGLHQTLTEIPLEYFDHALAWLRTQPGVDPDRIGVIGVSKGAEVSLLIATRDTKLKAVVAGAPSSNVWVAVESCGVDHRSSWTSGGVPVPALDCGVGDEVTDALSAYLGGLRVANDHPQTAIPIERSAAPILLVCGEADSLSPSCPMARRLLARGGDRVTLLAYPEAGHAGFGVPVPRDNPNYASLASLGGTPDGNAFARSDSWPRILAFLKAHL